MKSFLLFLLVVPGLAWSWDKQDFKDEVSVPLIDDETKKVLYIGAGVTAATLIFEDQIDPTHNEIVNHKPLGDFSRYGDWAGQLVPNLAYVVGQSVAGYYGNDKGYERALGMFKATLYSASVTTVLKYSIREPRPDNHKERNSFPSGHTTTAFAFSGYVLEEHGWKWGIPALGVSLLSGFSRVNDNRHRVHDVLSGATIGLAYGIGMSKLQKKNKGLAAYQIVPLFDQTTKGLAVRWEY